MKYLKMVVLEVSFLTILALVLLAIFGFFAGGKATGEIVANIFIFRQYTPWMISLVVSTIIVAIGSLFVFDSTNMFDNAPFGDLAIGVCAMVFATFIVWFFALMVVGLLGAFGKIFSKFFSDFMAGLNSRR